MVAGLAALFVLQSWQPQFALRNGLCACALMAALIAAHDLLRARTWQRDSAALRALAPRAVSARRVAVKLLGLAASLALPALAYALFPEYHGTFYDPWWWALRSVGPWLLALSPVYFAWMDGVLRDPHDGYWHLGAVLLRRERADWPRIAQHYGGWVVKGFFLPLMVVYLGGQVASTTTQFHRMTASGGLAVYDFGYNFVFLIDLMFAAIGYTMTLRVLDTQVRSTEPTGLGWMVALVCYQPFWSIIGEQYLRYGGGVSWGPWLGGHPWLQAAWGTIIIVLLVVYCLATVSFGLRFSNLTHRGILTSGPYRFSKHPAYLCKNLSWWLIAVPFVGAGLWSTLQACALLALVNLIYYLRAVTEERHLSRDPVYRAYSAWIAEHGFIAQLRRWLPGRTSLSAAPR